MSNKDKMDFLGITKFHEAGIKGKGITVASIENGKTTHSKMVLDILQEILPEATILTSIKYWRDDEISLELDGYTSSLEYSSTDDIEKVQKQRELYDRNVFMTCSVGNDSTKHYNDMAKYDEWVSIGACRLYSDGTVIPESYSSECEYLDFCSITNWDTKDGFFNGTSCATPVFQAMSMLIQCYFKQKYGKKLSNKQLYNYISRHCVDIGENGYDKKSGIGLFILPEPNKIEEGNIEIILKIGDNHAIVNNKDIILDVPPKIENGRTLVPIRFISENMNLSVTWNENTRNVIITN